MASRDARTAPIGEYTPLHITTTGTLVPVGLVVSTTAPTTIVAGAGVVVTPVSMVNITLGTILNIANGIGSAEDVMVKSMTATTFTADFASGHSGAYTIISHRGTFLGRLVVGQVGTSVTITLYNGHPSTLPNAGTVIGVITPTLGSTDFECVCDKGLFYTAAGTMGDYTLMYIDMAE